MFLKTKFAKGDIKNYHDEKCERGDPRFTMSASAMRLFHVCPSRWKAGYEPPGSESKRFGAVVDTLLLTPELFESRFAVRPDTYTNEDGEQKPFNANSKTCKTWISEQKDKEILTKTEHEEAKAAVKRLSADPLLYSFIFASDRQIWLSGQWKDEDTGITIPIKALLDCVPRRDSEFGKSLGDVKMIRNGAGRPFARQVFQYGWHIQAAFYLDFYMNAVNPSAKEDGEERNTFVFWGAENYKPYEPFRRLLSANFVEIGRKTYRSILARYCRCLNTGTWPGYDDNRDSIQGWGLCEPESWMEFESIQDALENEYENSLDSNDVPN